jgi:hypothetical protein
VRGEGIVPALPILAAQWSGVSPRSLRFADRKPVSAERASTRAERMLAAAEDEEEEEEEEDKLGWADAAVAETTGGREAARWA